MPERRASVSLSPRDREILKDIVHTYIVRGEPVSSRTVARHEWHGLSAASIRNVMADLEEMGFLAQPHTSAGRVPSSAGYHLYIESELANRSLPVRLRRQIDGELRERVGGGDQLVATASHLLSEISQQIGIVLTPEFGEAILKAVDFVPLSGCKILCVVISESGFVENKLIESSEPLAREELVEAANYLTENFHGLTLREIRDRLLALMAEERAQVDQLLARAIALARQGLTAPQGPEVVVQGTATVLAHPELGDLERVRRLLTTFADRERLVRLLSRCIEGSGVRVLIGDESDLTSQLDFSLVATTYGAGKHGHGTLGIFGPSRMDYLRVIPLVDYLGETLSHALEESFAQ